MNSLSEIELNIEQKAGEWFVLIHSNAATDEQLQRFFQWLNQSPRHAQAYKEYGEIWDELPQSETAEQAITLEKPSAVTRAIKAKATRFYPQMIAAMTSITAALMLAWVLMPQLSPSTQTTYSTEVGELQEIRLSDGSRLTLGANSEIEASLGEEHRHIKLVQGQAYFDVVSQYDKQGQKIPFTVVAQSMRVNVVGTQFSINLLDDKARVSVAEGEVHVDHLTLDDTPVVLTQGQAVIAIGPQLENLGDAIEANLDQVLSWKTGWLSYTDANLRDVIADARRYHKGRIELVDPSLELLRVTTSFRTDQISQMTHILETVLPVKVYHGDNNRILITPDRRIKTDQ